VLFAASASAQSPVKADAESCPANVTLAREQSGRIRQVALGALSSCPHVGPDALARAWQSPSTTEDEFSGLLSGSYRLIDRRMIQQLIATVRDTTQPVYAQRSSGCDADLPHA
jgi:hypothetical protein